MNKKIADDMANGLFPEGMSDLIKALDDLAVQNESFGTLIEDGPQHALAKFRDGPITVELVYGVPSYMAGLCDGWNVGLGKNQQLQPSTIYENWKKNQ